jgi:hypothetical protein
MTKWYVSLFGLAAVGATLGAGTSSPRGTDPIAPFYAHLTPAGRERLGVPLEQLKLDGRELAQAFLKPLARNATPSEADRWEASLIMKNQVKILGFAVQELGQPIDWLRVPQGPNEGGDAWTFELNVHYRWLPPLARVYRATGEEAMARKCVDILLDWIARFPYDSDQYDLMSRAIGPEGKEIWEKKTKVGDLNIWTSFAAAHRAASWVSMLGLLHDSRALDNRAVAIVLNSILDDHRRLVLAFPRTATGNQYLSLSSWLTELNRELPSFEGNAEAERIGWEWIGDYARRYVYPDGSNAECSPGYAIMSTGHLFGLVGQAERRGHPLPEGRERVRLAMRYFALIADPLGRSPRIAHSGSGDSIRDRLRGMNGSFHDPEVAFVASGGKEGKAPAQLNYIFPWAGHVVMRSGWDENATWLFFEPGPRGSGHYDLSQNGLQLLSRGEWLLTDPGYYVYETTGEAGAMSAYLKTTAAHNCALVDGQGQLPVAPGQRLGVNTKPGEYHWSEDDQTVSAEGAYSYGFAEPLAKPIPVVHRRRVTFHKREDRFTIEDRFEGTGKHRVDIHWQGYPGAKVTTGQGNFSFQGQKARLEATLTADIPLAISVAQGRKEPFGGWFSAGYGKLESAPMVVVSGEAALPLTVTTELNVGVHNSESKE